MLWAAALAAAVPLARRPVPYAKAAGADPALVQPVGSSVSGAFPAPVTLPGRIPSTSPALPVAAAPPAAIEIPEIDSLLHQAIRAGKTPGAVVLVGRRGGVVFRRAYGRRALLPEREAMTVDTVFDLASLTKPLVVGTLVQWLIEQGRLDIRAPAVKYLPEFGVRDKYLVTVEQLLLHTSGLPPTNSLRDYRRGPVQARALALGGYLYKYPNREFIYSDLGYIALGELIESVTGERLDRTAERVLWQPLGMRDTRFCPTHCDDPRIAPTELNHGWTENPIRGEPSDTRAYRLGGVAGNAGLFSTADDLARFARMLLGGGELEGVRALSAERVEELLRPRAVPNARRSLGWDVSSSFSSGRGRELSDRAVGHGGYTGTSLWIDPALDLFIVFLSNRNHPYATGRVTDVQGDVADAAVRAVCPDRRSPTPRAAPDAGSSMAASEARPVPDCAGDEAAECPARPGLPQAGG